MAYDQVTVAADTTDNPAGLSVLVVDPNILSTTAQLLRELPGPRNPGAAAPTAEVVGHTALAEAIEAYHNRYRDFAEALADDNDATARYLDDAADTYQRVEDRITAILTDAAERLHDAPENTDPDRTHSDRDDTDRDDRHRAGTDGDGSNDGSQYAEWGDDPARNDPARDDPAGNDPAADYTGRNGADRDDTAGEDACEAAEGEDGAPNDGGWNEAAEREMTEMTRRIREALEA